jgi:hypothetical protein
VTFIISLLGSGSGLTFGNCLCLCLFITLAVISLQSPILEITEQNLADHMVIEHTIFFFLGASSVKTAEVVLRVLVSYIHARRRSTSFQANAMTKNISGIPQGCYDHGDQDGNNNNNGIDRNNNNAKLLVIIIQLWSNIVKKIFSISSKYGLLWFLVASILLAIWHWPPLFDYAVLHENIHILQHISFIIVGAAAFIALRTLGESFKIIILIALNAVMAFTGLLLSVTAEPVYTLYSINDHNQAGDYMLITCILLLLIGLPAYLIHRALFHMRVKIRK